MPRSGCGSVGGYWYHVLNRGNGHDTVFHKPQEHQALVGLIAETRLRHPMRLLAYGVMPNRLRLVLWTVLQGPCDRTDKRGEITTTLDHSSPLGSTPDRAVDIMTAGGRRGLSESTMTVLVRSIPSPRYGSPAEVAAFLGISTKTVRRLVRRPGRPCLAPWLRRHQQGAAVSAKSRARLVPGSRSVRQEGSDHGQCPVN